jgi:hypothetical protein
MKRSRTRVALTWTVGTLLLASVASADVLLFDFSGYDYWDGSDCYNAIGYVTEVNPTLLNFNYADNEYTFSLQDACPATVDTIGTWVVYTFTGGTLDIYCDPLLGGTAADYGSNPPNLVAPSTFEDGECVLGGDFTQLQFFLDTASGMGSLDGQLTFVRGTQLENIHPSQRDGWSLAANRQGTPGAPEGYFSQTDGQVFVPEAIPVKFTSWGLLKSRGEVQR